MAALQVGHRARRPVPENFDDFTDVSHGATFMGHFERCAAFEFLRDPSRRTALSGMKCFGTDHDNSNLQELLDIFRRKHLDVYAVDLSTDEAVRCGIRAVRVIIPGLQPLGFYYRARYLGHPRLYHAPLAMGYPSRPEADLNAWPQPFD
jgi:ribosomal protein S12 methylthiotransferase accessory factor